MAGQVVTTHLASMGGKPVPRDEFAAALAHWTREGRPPARWPADSMADLTWS